MKAASICVFVYGTLRKGASNAQRMSSARFLFDAHISGTLYKVDWYPGITLDGDTLVRGEVYELSWNELSKLDDYEGSEYRRVIIKLQGDDQQSIDVWVYEFIADTKNLQTIPSGDWLEVESGIA